MSAEEHYFENLLIAFAKGGLEMYDKISESDSNLEELDVEVKEAIETCAIHMIELCEWDEKEVGKMLKVKI